MNLREFFKDPISSIFVNEISIILALSLFLPFIAPHIKNLKIFGAEVEFQDKIKEINKDIKEIRSESKIYQNNQESLIYSIIASVGRSMDIQPRRLNKSLKEVPLEIGFKNFPESRILAEIMYCLFNIAKIPVNPPVIQQNTLGNFYNLRTGKIDFYIEYSGTGFVIAGLEIEEHTPEGGKDRLNKIYKGWRLEWLSPIGFSNQDILVMQRDKAEKYGIKYVSDLALRSEEFILGAEPEYFVRDASYPRLKILAEKAETPLKFQIRESDIGDRYKRLLDGEFDVINGWNADPEIEDPRLEKIKWDQQFPENKFYAMPLCRDDVVPNIIDVLSNLRIDIEEMRKLNLKAKNAGNTDLAIKGIAAEFCRKLENVI